jgi:oligopeptide transport system substrate-binding protein
MYNTADMHRNIAVAIQQMWKKELNVNVTLENQEWKVFLSTRQGKNFDVARAGSSSGIADPIDFLSSFTTGHGMNDAAWANPEYDRLIDLSNQAVDEKERFELLYQAEAILLDQLPMLPIFYYNSSYLKSTRVKGFNFNMLAQPNYKGVYIDMGTTNE